jgi:hypothetical protein
MMKTAGIFRVMRRSIAAKSAIDIVFDGTDIRQMPALHPLHALRIVFHRARRLPRIAALARVLPFYAPAARSDSRAASAPLERMAWRFRTLFPDARDVA